MLEALGVSPDEEAIYTTLLDSAPLGMSDLRRAHGGTSVARLRRLLAALEDKGLVTRTAGPRPRYSPVAPDTALEGMLISREEQLHRARASVARLAERHRRSPRTGVEAVEIVPGPAAVQRWGQNHLSARSEVRAFERPPYGMSVQLANPDELDKLAQGVRYRLVYGREAVETQTVENIAGGIAAGEEARVVGEVPLRLALIDDRFAMLPVRRGHLIAEGIFVVHRSALLDALSELFELVWSQALPLGIDERGPEAVDDTLLALLAAGLSDGAIGRQLGISRRTLERRMHDLMTALNARTRFQAGVLVAHRKAAQGDPQPD